MEVAQGLHPLHLMQHSIPRMLHLVHFEEQESPARLDIEIYSREPSRCKCADIHYELTRKSDAHVDEYGCNGALVTFASWLRV